MTNIQRSLYQFHPYHLVDSSPWPFMSSFSLLTLPLSGVMYLNGYKGGGEGLIAGIISLLLVMVLWFRDVSTEGTFLGNHTFAVQKGLNLGFNLFIVSEFFFFMSVFWAYFHSALSPTVELGAHWPPAGIEALNPFEIPLLNTVILLSSGAAVTYGHHAQIKGIRKAGLIGIATTVFLAVIFTGLQGVEYAQAPFTISDGAYGSTFFFATGFHGFHVIVGLLFIATGLGRAINYHLTNHHHLGLEASILYWHFVDVVWIFLYLSIYWWGS